MSIPKPEAKTPDLETKKEYCLPHINSNLKLGLCSAGKAVIERKEKIEIFESLLLCSFHVYLQIKSLSSPHFTQKLLYAHLPDSPGRPQGHKAQCFFPSGLSSFYVFSSNPLI